MTRTPDKSFYVYIHYKADTNEPFYVGKGKGNRANSRDNRSKRWLYTVKKHGLAVKFYRKGLTEQQAFDLEIETIAKLRDKDVILVNLTAGGEGVSLPEQTNKRKQELRDFYKKHGRRPNGDTGSRKEKILYGRLHSYIGKSQDCYDADFAEEVRGWENLKAQKIRVSKEEILSLFKKTGHLPSKTAGDAEEARLAYKLSGYTSETASQYDPVFTAKIKSLRSSPDRKNRRERYYQTQRDAFILKWTAENRLPLNHKDHGAYQSLRRWCSPSSPHFNQEVFDAMVKLGYKPRGRKH